MFGFFSFSWWSKIFRRIRNFILKKLKTDRSDHPVPATQSVKGSRLAPAQRSEAEIAQSAEWVEMTAPTNGDGSAVLVRYGKDQSKRIRKHFEELQRTDATPWHGGKLGPEIAYQLASASSLVMAGLQNGQVFQVIGTPQLVEGLKMGTHVLMQTAEGTLGTVVSSSSGKIAGQLRFAPASVAPFLAPVLAWQVLHAIASTSQLRKINLRLDSMQRKLETIVARDEAGVLGEILNAIHTLDDILAERENTGTFTRDMETRLALIEKTIGSFFERNRSFVELFHSKTSEIHRLSGKTGAVQATNFLQEEGRQAMHDMEILAALVAADLRIKEARVYHAMEHNPTDIQRRLNNTKEKADEYRELLENLPSVEGLKSHAQECVEEMSWWKRQVSARGVRKETTKLDSLDLRDVKVQAGESSTEGRYMFWNDEAGDTKIYMLPNGDDDE